MAGDDARARGHRTQGETPAQAGDHDGERVHRGHPAREAPSSGACELADVVQRLVALRQHAEISESTLRSIVFRVLCALHGVSPDEAIVQDCAQDAASVPDELSERVADIVRRAVAQGLGPFVLGALHEGSSDFVHQARRRNRGVYYTPPTIARYMANLTIRGWWAETQRVISEPAEALRVLESVRVLEPACGGGALLVAALEVLRELLLEGYQHVATCSREAISRAPSAIARRVVRHNLIGVDVDPLALEVTARSLWLACCATDKPGSPGALAPSLRQRDFVLDGAPERVDIVLGNPPYDALCPRERARHGAAPRGGERYTRARLAALRRDPDFVDARGGKLNLYELFLCRGASALKPGGRMTMIVPMGVLGDRQAAALRARLLDTLPPRTVDCFPQKDRARDRVFAAAKIATCVIQCERPRDADAAAPAPAIAIRSHPGGRPTTPWGQGLEVMSSALARLDPEGRAIPTCGRADWRALERLLARNPGLQRLGAHARQRQGELNETVYRRRGALTDARRAPGDVEILRGANLTRYCVREASQGTRLFLRSDARSAGARASRLADHRAPRIGFQRSAPQNNFRRLIAAPIAAGLCCFDTVSYVPPSSSRLPLAVILALMNSALYEWWFRLTSSNSKINAYQFQNLPLPQLVEDREAGARARAEAPARRLAALRARRQALGASPRWGLEWAGELADAIVAIEATRTLGARRERAALAPASARVQALLDDVVFALFELDDETAAVIRARAASRA